MALDLADLEVNVKTNGLTETNVELDKTDKKGQSAGKSLGDTALSSHKLSNAMLGLAISSSGANAQVSRLIGILLTLGGGTGILLVIAAAIAVASAAFNYLNKQINATKIAAGEAAKEITKMRDAAENPMDQLANNLNRINGRLLEINPQIAQLTAEFKNLTIAQAIYGILVGNLAADWLKLNKLISEHKLLVDAVSAAAQLQWGKYRKAQEDINEQFEIAKVKLRAVRENWPDARLAEALERIKLEAQGLNAIQIQAAMVTYRATVAIQEQTEYLKKWLAILRQLPTEAPPFLQRLSQPITLRFTLPPKAVAAPMPAGETGGLTQFYEQIDEEMTAALAGLQRHQLDMLGQFGSTLAGAMQQFFENIFDSKHVGQTIAQFVGTVLKGLGTMFIQMGIIYKLYGAIMKALAKLLTNPFTAGFAALAIGAALVALGSALGGVGRGQVAETGAGAVGGIGQSPVNLDRLTQTTFNPFDVSRAQALGGRAVTVNATIIGPNDPVAQRQISELVSNAARRGL